MVRFFQRKYFRAIKVGAIVGIFPLIFLLGVVMSSVKIDPSLHSPTDTTSKESSPPSDTQEVRTNHTDLLAITSKKANVVQKSPQLADIAKPKLAAQEQVAPITSIEPHIPEIKTATNPPQSQQRCPHGTYIDANDNEVCRPFEDYPPVQPIDPLPCVAVPLDNIQLLPPVICTDLSV